MRVAQNDSDDRAGLRGYVQFNKYTYIQGMRVVGVPVGTEQFQRDFLKEAINGEPAELVRALAPMEDAQASF